MVFLQSVIVPVYNAEKWLNECMESIFQQIFKGTLELSIYEDGSQVGILIFLSNVLW